MPVFISFPKNHLSQAENPGNPYISISLNIPLYRIGVYSGYRKTGHGRNGIKRILFLSAMSVRNCKTNMKDFYERLVNNGKRKMVALTALMRKILVIANAKLRDLDTILFLQKI